LHICFKFLFLAVPSVKGRLDALSLPLPGREGIKGRGKQRAFLGGSKITVMRRKQLAYENHL
jgi:hypothetical protein